MSGPDPTACREHLLVMLIPQEAQIAEKSTNDSLNLEIVGNKAYLQLTKKA